jgi:hypothetical protein
MSFSISENLFLTIVVAQLSSKRNSRQPQAEFTAQNRKLRDGAFAAFTKLISSESEDAFEEQSVQIQQQYAKYPAWLAYFRNQHISQRERWGKPWCVVRVF